MADLAKFCESRDLPGEARQMWIRILIDDPENEEAWTKLGGSHGRKGWRLKVRGRYYTLDQLRERVSDWKNAMELRTAATTSKPWWMRMARCFLRARLACECASAPAIGSPRG